MDARARGMGRVGERIFVVLVWTAVVLNFVKGLPHAVSELGFPYWTVNYSDGFIRRALVGTVAHELIRGNNSYEQRANVLGIHVAMTFAFWTMMFLWARHASRLDGSVRTERLVLVGGAGVFLSQLPSTSLALASYLDVFLLSLSAACAYHAIRGRYVVAGIIGAVGPFVHEGFLFLWLPIALLSARQLLRTPRGERRALLGRMAPLLSPVVAAALTMAFHSPSAAAHMIDKAPVDATIRQSFHVFQYGLKITDAFFILAKKYATYPGQVLLAMAFFLPPIVVTAVCAHALDAGRGRWKKALFTFVTTLAPCAILLIAWDLSRFLLWSGASAFFLLMSNATSAAKEVEGDARPKDVRAGVAPMLALAGLVLFSTGPHAYAYFEVVHVEYAAGPSLLRWTPAARLTYAFARVYNRFQFTGDWSSLEDGRCTAIAPGVEKIAPCSFVARPGQYVETRELRLAPGTYEATFRASPATAACPAKDPPVAAVMPHFFWRFEDIAADKRFTITEPTTTAITFVMDEEVSVMATVKVSIAPVDGCVRVDEIRLRRKD